MTLRCQEPLHRHGTVSLLAWTRTDPQRDDFVLFYRDKRLYGQYQHRSYRGRAKLRDTSSVKDGFSSGDFSIVLQNISSEDAGTYECRVVMRPAGGGDGGSVEVKRLIKLKVSGEQVHQEASNVQEMILTPGSVCR